MYFCSEVVRALMEEIVSFSWWMTRVRSWSSVSRRCFSVWREWWRVLRRVEASFSLWFGVRLVIGGWVWEF